MLQASLLKFDIDSLPDRNEIRLDSGGLTLSGARNIVLEFSERYYLDTELYIIDNALSGLDTQTATEIFHQAMGPTGLVHEKKATVVWCTESTKYLPLARQLIVFRANEIAAPLDEDAKHVVAPSSAGIEEVGNSTFTQGLPPAINVRLGLREKSSPLSRYQMSSWCFLYLAPSRSRPTSVLRPPDAWLRVHPCVCDAFACPLGTPDAPFDESDRSSGIVSPIRMAYQLLPTLELLSAEFSDGAWGYMFWSLIAYETQFIPNRPLLQPT